VQVITAESERDQVTPAAQRRPLLLVAALAEQVSRDRAAARAQRES
jgi:hypothetical protein